MARWLGFAARAGLNLNTISWASSQRRVTREVRTAAAATAKLIRLIAAIPHDPDAASVHRRIRSLLGEDWLQAHNLAEPDIT